MCVQQRQAEPTCRILCMCMRTVYDYVCVVCVFIPVCACLQKSTCTCVCVYRSVACVCVCVCVCVCAVCVHRTAPCAGTHGLGRGSWPSRVANRADTLSLPSCPSPAPASHPPEGSQAEWRLRYCSVPAAAWCLPGLCPRAAWAPLGAAWVQDWPFPAGCPLPRSA